jgi:hypothetical protein
MTQVLSPGKKNVREREKVERLRSEKIMGVL